MIVASKSVATETGLRVIALVQFDAPAHNESYRVLVDEYADGGRDPLQSTTSEEYTDRPAAMAAWSAAT